MWELDYEESWVPKNWCFWTAVLEKTLESPLDFKDIQPVHPKGDQSWVFIGETDAEAETPILWPPDVKSWLIWKDPDAGRDWGQEEKGMTEDEIAGWHHCLNGREFEQTPGDGEGQGSLECYSSRGCKESDTTTQTEQQKTVVFPVSGIFSLLPILCLIKACTSSWKMSLRWWSIYLLWFPLAIRRGHFSIAPQKQPWAFWLLQFRYPFLNWMHCKSLTENMRSIFR